MILMIEIDWRQLEPMEYILFMIQLQNYQGFIELKLVFREFSNKQFNSTNLKLISKASFKCFTKTKAFLTIQHERKPKETIRAA